MNRKITLDSLRYSRNHKELIEPIRRDVQNLGNENRIDNFAWVKAHVWHLENELSDQLAK
jgi:hypothetical protein